MQTEHENVGYDLETGLPIENEKTPYVLPVIEGEEIVGGTETDDFPDCCAVGDEEDYYCSGTLIASSVVVTAAHCRNAKRVFLKGGDVDEPEKGETISVTKQIFHPKLDLSVLILEQHSTVAPRHVAQGPEVNAAKTAMVAGFGTVNLHGTIGYGIKRCVKVPVMSLDGKNPGDSEKYGCRVGHEIVAGHRGLKRDTCKGDSGGPLYIKHPSGEYYLLGATSRGSRDSDTVCGDGGIYVRVDLCLNWIRDVTGVDIDGSRE